MTHPEKQQPSALTLVRGFAGAGRSVACALAAGVSLALLAACGGNSTPGETGPSNSGNSTHSSSASTGVNQTSTGTTVVVGTSTLADGGVVTTSSTVTTTSTAASSSASTTVTGDGGGGGNPVVNLGMTDQTIEGFGINDTWAPNMTSQEASALFGTTGSGIGLSILRVGMGSNGMPMSANIPGDITMAKAAGATKIIGSTWTPPMSCKTNMSENNGGYLISTTTTPSDNGACYTSWATSITNFAKSQNLYAMSIANEPDFASCGSAEPCNGTYQTTVYTANEMVAFLKVVGPMLKTAGIKVISPEASEWNHAWSNISATGSQPNNKPSSDPLKCGCFSASQTCASSCSSGGGYDYGHYLAKDSTAWGDFDIFGVHEYDSQVATPWPSDVTAAKKEVWQTEMSGVKWWAQQGPSCDIANGVAVAGWIHSALVDGEASAWLWWWYQASSTDDNEGLLLATGSSALSSCNNSTDTKRHYTLGNFSKFIRPGYVRVLVSGSAPGVLLSAYKGTDGTVVIVAINNSSSSVTVPIAISGGTTTPASMTPWVTSATDNLASKTAVTVSNGSFMATLAGTTVTTFVGK
jgi:glucuronoarabinoxylan endo-1,4-beta-xylanase